jgi:hypothetical protein
MLERRRGIRQAPLGDNVLALPFGGQEEDYWSTGLGLEHLPSDGPYRMSARGEIREGSESTNRLLTVAGDLTFNQSFAALSRQEGIWTRRFQNGDEQKSHRLWSLWGLAFRPAESDALNVLVKVEWREEKDPGGAGVLNTQGSKRRFILTSEVIWAPRSWLETGARYSVRNARTTATSEQSLDGYSLNTTADYMGVRGELGIHALASVRVDARLLRERESEAREWDFAPSLVLNVLPGIEIQGGYRFGDLQDPDFLVRGGEGVFLNIGTRLSEGTVSKIADFWRSRFSRGS